MEARAVGTVDEGNLDALLQLLTALAGHEPVPVDIHELVLQHQGAPRQEVHLRHVMVPADGSHPPADRWTACQYSRPPWGDLNMAKLPATIRTVTQAHCSGPDVPGFWKGLGFNPRYQYYKKGHVFDIQRGIWTLHVLASKLHKVREGPAGEAIPGDELVPIKILLDVWVDVGSGAHMDAIAAVVDVGKLLGPHGVALQPLPEAKGRPRGPMMVP